MKPIVAIVGRPNVGKSTLFNRIVGKKRAVVESFSGLTRDRLYGEAAWGDKNFLIVDTGGFQPAYDIDEAHPDRFSGTSRIGTPGFQKEIVQNIIKQALIAVKESDVIIMLMDAETGLMPSDVELINTLRKYSKKIFYVVNKIDGPKKEKSLYDFYPLGVTLFPVSALNGYGFDEFMDSIMKVLPESTEEPDEYPKIAILGRPNVGKSTLVNSLLGKERMIVSPVPGTTRDAVNSMCRYQKKKYLIIDTAGIRKKGKMAKTFEKYSFIKTLRNIESCDVALILIDSVDGVVEMDQKIANLVCDAGKGVIILLNKWDLTDKSPGFFEKLQGELKHKLWFMHYAPVLTISALSRQRITKLFPLVDEIITERSKKISTHELNIFLRESLLMQPPPLYKNKKVKLYYITQVGVNPPRFVLFTSRTEGIKPEYIRFLEKQLRERFSFKGTPVRFHIRQKTKQEQR
ncbi:MAG: ribosome biogenesis GTPase Der [Thermodesulfovibrionia bacterium]|nr:ribosome biogenesis GTPase Der [Thermodesulfovibrionia bacterium]